MFFTNAKDGLWIGVDSIDRERRKLFALMEELFAKFDSFASAHIVSGDFAALAAQVSAEFAAEERLMRAKRYASYDAHKAEHERLLKQLREMIEAYEDGMCTVCGTTLRTCFETWLGNHVRNDDAALTALVN